MFGIGLPELLVILVIALIVIGPEKLPELAKTLGKTFYEFKKVIDGVKDSVNEEEARINKSLQASADKKKSSLSEKQKELEKEYEEALKNEEEGDGKA